MTADSSSTNKTQKHEEGFAFSDFAFDRGELSYCFSTNNIWLSRCQHEGHEVLVEIPAEAEGGATNLKARRQLLNE